MSETYEAIERERNKLRNDLEATKQKLVTIEQNAQDEIDRLNEQNYAQSIKLEAAQLHIKELRSSMIELCDVVDVPPDRNCSCHICPPCSDCVEYSGIRDALHGATKLLAKQPDTRALDEALLKAEILVLEGSIGCTDFERNILLHDRKAKIA